MNSTIYDNVLVIDDVYDRVEVQETVLKHNIHDLVDTGCTYFESDVVVPGKVYRVPLRYCHDEALYIQSTFSPVIKTLDCFNFTINKKTLNRFLLIKLLEYFNLSTQFYTWSGVDSTYNLSIILDDLDRLNISTGNDIKSSLLSKITTVPKFYSNTGDVNSGSYIKTTPNYSLIQHVFENTAVSLIAESSAGDHSALDNQIHFTEKTMGAMLGLNFPIWVGGYAQADTWESLGFDAFADVIDHSYQYRDTMVERCYYSIKNNLHLLTNLELCASLRNQYHDRLLNNRKLILHKRISTLAHNAILHMPPYIIDILKKQNYAQYL